MPTAAAGPAGCEPERGPPAEASLPADSRWTRIEHLEEVTSTNDVAAAHARAGEPSGLVVVADHQTAGRGRHGRRWADEPGRSLLVSVVVADVFARPTLVPLAAGLAVADAAAALGATPALRWPNDVTVDDRKCAGVLVEAVGAGPALVVGVGVNVDWRGVDRDAESAAWGSLSETVGGDVSRWRVLGHLLTALDAHLAAAEREPERLLGDYRARCATLGREVEVTTGAGVVVGAAADVGADGELVVRTGERAVSLRAGDVVHVHAGG